MLLSLQMIIEFVSFKVLLHMVLSIELHRSFYYLLLIHSLSLSYFRDKDSIQPGCYFLVSSTWLQKWRDWLRDDTDVTYKEVKEISYPYSCRHHHFYIPGYINHFITGMSSVPCLVRFRYTLNNEIGDE